MGILSIKKRGKKRWKSDENFAKFKKTTKSSGEPFENSLNNTKKVNYSKFSDEEILKRIIKNKSEIINILRDELVKKEVKSEAIDKISEKTTGIPINIFSSNIGGAEVLVKYLYENEKLKFSEIARLINRDQRTVWNNYNNSKKIKELKINDKSMQVPVFIFSDRRLSIFESIVKYLREKGYKNYEIAEMLKKDERNIGTFYFRSSRKIAIS